MSLWTITAAALLAACREPASGAPEVLAQACEVAEAARLVAAPPGFVADPDTWYGLHVFGAQLLFTFDRLDDPDRVYWRFDRCSGELAPFTSLAPGLHNPYAITTADGTVVYANDALGKQYVVDRLDVAGDDEARPVQGLPERLSGTPWPALATSAFVLYSESHATDSGAFAAGIGGATHSWYLHAGDPAVPAVKLGDDFVLFRGLDPRREHNLVLTDDGALRRLELPSGAGELLLTGVRAFTPLPGLDKLVWQEIGDDVAETIYLHDFATGDDLPIAVNDFAQKSWARDLEQIDLGSLHTNADASVVVLPGPGGPLVTAVSTADGSAFAVPEHLAFHGALGDQFILLTEDGPERVLALWDPPTGEVREWYRGPRVSVTPRRVEGDAVEYFQADPGDLHTGTLWRVDLATGERQPLVSRSSWNARELADGRYFLTFRRRDLPGPPLSGARYVGASVFDLKLVDPASGLYTAIADDVTAFSPGTDALVYLAPQGPAPGVWVHPLPLKP